MNRHVQLSRQGGVMLLEGLIAILIFSFGILGIIGLQVTSVKQSTAAKYRTEASMLANQLIGQMWSGNRNEVALANTYASPGGSGYQTWRDTVMGRLPGVTASTNAPTVSFNGSVATITVFWKAPDEPAADAPHQYVVLTQVR